VFHRRITRTFFGFDDVLVNDNFSLYNWLELDNCFGSYINAIYKNVNFDLRWNSLLGFTDYFWDGDMAFVPSLSSLAIKPSYWPNNMRFNMRSNGLMFDELSDITTNYAIYASYFYGYPHLGRPNDYSVLTPMDAIFIDNFTYEHIKLIKNKNGDAYKNEQSQLITFLLNEVEPWYLDLQNQNLGKHARSNYNYVAHYMAKHQIQMGYNLSPKTPFGNYVVEPNVDVDYQAGDAIVLKSGTHIKNGASAHLYIEQLCYQSNNSNGKLINSESKNQRNSGQTDSTFMNVNMKNEVAKNDWYLYPNPGNGKLSIMGSKVKQGDFLYIYTLQGVKLAKIYLNQDATIDLSNYINNNTVLLIQWYSENTLKGTKKWIIQ
jgi:hypothetical protein